MIIKDNNATFIDFVIFILLIIWCGFLLFVAIHSILYPTELTKDKCMEFKYSGVDMPDECFDIIIKDSCKGDK